MSLSYGSLHHRSPATAALHPEAPVVVPAPFVKIIHRVPFLLATSLAAVALVVHLSATPDIFEHSSTSTLSSGQPILEEGVPKLNVTFDAFNAYTENVSTPYVFLPWQKIAEPYRTTTLRASTVMDSQGGLKQLDGDYAWEIDGQTLSGHTVTHLFTTTGFHNLTLIATIQSNQFDSVAESEPVLTIVEEALMVKYIRREVRNLKDADLSAFLDALSVVYYTDTPSGRLLYGAAYYGIEYYIRKHLYGAASRKCDHWHDGAGIMTHHVGFTLEFERNLQVVDPKVSIPYWEYTKDDADYCVQSGSSTCWENSISQQSPMFDPEWFGEANPSPSGDHSILVGRWASLPVLQAARNFSSITNSYGLLRSPWNTDPTPYVMRFGSVNGGSWEPMVGCSRWDACFKSDSIGEMNNCLNGGTHGPIHIMLGGQWDMNHSIIVDKTSPFNGISGPHLLLAKHLWRYGYVNCPDVCTHDTPSSQCKCECSASAREGATAYEILAEKTEIMHWLASHAHGAITFDGSKYSIEGYTEEKQTKTWDLLLNALCDPGHVGEMYTSAAPYDPIFWVIHPTAERLLGWRRILSEYGWRPLNETWSYAHHDDTSDFGKICHWESNVTLPRCDYGVCPGHGANDILPFPGLIEEFASPTNTEVYDFIHPWNPALPYAYDSFLYNHCARENAPIGWDVVPDEYKVR